jgi:hypothetical protein
MARSSLFGNGAGLDLHARTEIVPSGTWSLISDAALRIGSDVFEFSNDGSYYFNGDKNVNLPVQMAGQYSITMKEGTIETATQNGNVITERKIFFTIDLGNGEAIKMNLFKKMIAVRVNVFLKDTFGMLGIHGKTGMIGRDGESSLTEPNVMGTQWQVNDSEPMLFHDIQAPQYPETCRLPTVKSRKLRVSNDFRLIAAKACEEVDEDVREFCIEDVLVTGDIGVAKGYGSSDGFSF